LHHAECRLSRPRRCWGVGYGGIALATAGRCLSMLATRRPRHLPAPLPAGRREKVRLQKEVGKRATPGVPRDSVAWEWELAVGCRSSGFCFPCQSAAHAELPRCHDGNLFECEAHPPQCQRPESPSSGQPYHRSVAERRTSRAATRAIWSGGTGLAAPSIAQVGCPRDTGDARTTRTANHRPSAYRAPAVQDL
jgi:hypothetical protein